MRLALAIVLTTFVSGSAAHAGGAKAAAPRKTGIKFMVDKVNKDKQVVERVVVEGPLGKTRAGKKKGRKNGTSRELTLQQDLKAANKGMAVNETDAAMPDGDLTLGGRLEEVGSLVSSHNGGTIKRTEYRRKGAYHQGTGVETRVYARGKLRTIRPAGKTIEEPLMLGKGGGVVNPIIVEVATGEPEGEDGEEGQRSWGAMSGTRLDFQPSRPYSVMMFVSAGRAIPLDRELISQVLRTGNAGKGDLVLRSDGEHITVTSNAGGMRSDYRLPHDHVKTFMQATYRSVPRGDELRWVNLGNGLE
jgi:hypothetical protein